MNSPEEKARQIVDKFRTFVVMWSGGVEVENGNVKQCALICVDEIISALNEVVDDYMHVDAVPGSIGGANYYQQVKEEIRKL